MKYQIHSEICGPWENFSHIIEDKETKKAIIIDPAWDADRILARIAEHKLTVDAIWLTHSHHDHVNAVIEIRYKIKALNLSSCHDVPVYLHQNEIAFLQKNPGVHPFGTIPEDTQPLNDQDELHLGSTIVKVIHTPGHSMGSCCFLMEHDMITGDTLFIDGAGRTDLLGSEPADLVKSLQKIMLNVPHHVILHTGHAYGPTATATLSAQIQTNPYLRQCLELVKNS